MAVKQLHLNDGSKTPIEPVISNDSIADNMITLNKLSEPVVTEDTYNQDKNTFVTKAELTPLQQKVDNNTQKLTTLESNVGSKQDIIDGKVTSFKKGTQFTGNLTLDVPTINDATMAGQTDIDGILAIPNNTDLQIEGKGLKQYIVDNIPPSTGGGGAGVQLSAPNTATNGTITQGQLTTLQESDLNYIIFNNEIYSLNDKTHTADTLTYSHVGFENGKHLLKTISITVSTRAWVLNTTEVSSGGSGSGGQIPQGVIQYVEYSLSDEHMNDLVTGMPIQFKADDITSRTNVIKLINYSAGITFQLYLNTGYPDEYEGMVFKTLIDYSLPSRRLLPSVLAKFNRVTKELTITTYDPLPTMESIGLVAAAPKTSKDTIPVTIDSESGLLYVAPSGGSAVKGYTLSFKYKGGPLINDRMIVGHTIKTDFSLWQVVMPLSGSKPNLQGSTYAENVRFFIPSQDIVGATINIEGELYSSNGTKITNADTLISAKSNLLYLLSDVNINIQN